jgi:hypothetical protein
MPNQKISELTAIVTVDNSVDVLPIVDISANTTKKVTPNALKTALALDNVNNTSDANKPVSIAQQDALNAKVDENAPIVAATKTKITYDAKGLVTAGDILDAADMPTGINAANIGTGVVSSTEFGYLDGVTSAIQTQINSKQATLVSGTNIKTINSTSLLGSGDITISANPSGVSGAIQFSDGSAFSSDATKFFWDNTNKRLGVGTNTPTTALHIVGQTTFSDNALFSADFKYIGREINNSSILFSNVGSIIRANISTGGQFSVYNSGTGSNRFAVSNGGQTTISGGGSTSATTSLLVQNSAGTQAFKVGDSGIVQIGLTSGINWDFSSNTLRSSQYAYITSSNGSILSTGATSGGVHGNNNGGKVADSGIANAQVASAVLEVSSTTRGFLPPRMTTTERNAIASPAAGLVVYDSTTNKLCCYNGSTWNDLF